MPSVAPQRIRRPSLLMASVAVVVGVAVVAGALAGWTPVAPSDASMSIGTPGPDGYADLAQATPALVACPVAARSFPEIEAMRQNAQPATRTPGPVPVGPPADRETAKQIRQTVEELLACFATGEPLRVWSLYSDAYLGRLLDRQRGFDRALYDAYATPRPAAPGERVRLIALADVNVLDDGRVGATAILYYPGIGVEKRFFIAFVKDGERWLIDEIVGEITFSVPLAACSGRGAIPLSEELFGQ